MKFIINSSVAASDSSLYLNILGFSIELSNISDSEKIAIEADSGRVSIDVIPALESLSTIEMVTENIENVELEKPFNEELSGIQNVSTEILFKKLVELRRQIAQESAVPAYIIFHDTTLKDMVSKMPVDLDEMKGVFGIGQSKLQKYGVRFVEAIQDHLASTA